MEITLPVFLLFIFLVPGLLFSLTFYRVDGSLLNIIPLTYKAAVSLSATLFLHSAAIFLLKSVFKYTINFSYIVALVSGKPDSLYINALKALTTKNLLFAIMYITVICIAAILLGTTARRMCKWLHIDRIFGLDNNWYYLLTGYDWEEGTPDGVIISALIEFSGKGYLYLGVLEDFFLDKNGNLERLVLYGAWRREISNDKPEGKEDDSFEDRFYSIDGDSLVIKYSDIKNLNIKFVKVETEAE